MSAHSRLSTICVLLGVSICGTGCQQQSGSSSSTLTPSYKPIEITTKTNVDMVLIPGGAFTMGSNKSADDESPAHELTISAFAMDKFEVTQDLYAALEVPDPSHFKDPKRPVEQVRWSEAASFCNIRSIEEDLEPCYDEATFECNFEATGYRLPTEAEWEYAARAGLTTEYAFDGGTTRLKSYACYSGNSKKKTDRVGTKKPNAWGLHDMSGNVFEWCHDIYDVSYYQNSPTINPRGPSEGKKRVLRGGCWNTSEDACRTSARFSDVPGITDACFAIDIYGFRCVRRLTPDEAELLK